MGVPVEDREELHSYASRFIADDTVPEVVSLRLQYEAIMGMTAYFQRKIERGADEASEGHLISAMLKKNSEKQVLSTAEIMGNCFLLMVAGHETTVNLLGNGLYVFLRETALWRQLRRKPELLPGAIEEVLRIESPVQLSSFRMNVKESEFCGVKIPEGSPVTAMIGAANRDPRVFAQPDEFQIGRNDNRHLAFGSGPHRCIGSQMARIEGRVGFGVLLEHAPQLRLAGEPRWSMSDSSIVRQVGQWFGERRQGSEPMQWRRNPLTRGLRRLSVAF